MDRETLSNYGWITIVTLVLVVLLTLATPFGTYISNGIISVSRGYNAVAEKKMSEENLNKTQAKFESVIKTNKDAEDTTKPSGALIPTGATYTKADGTTLEGNGTNKFPDAPETGDTYEYGDYIYTYNAGSDYGTEWSVLAIANNKTSYGEILSKIAGKPVTNMFYTFDDCKFLTTTPVIPNSITDMCLTFNDCTSLTVAPKIPSSVTNMYGTFGGCTSLTTAPEIPNGVTDISYTFSYCASLTTVSAIPNSVTDMQCTFEYCKSLTTVPTIPNSVTNMSATFQGCTSLITVPAIPNSVTNMRGTFQYCTSLAGTIEINANPSIYDNCFNSTVKSIVLTGSSTKLTELAASATNSNVTVK